MDDNMQNPKPKIDEENLINVLTIFQRRESISRKI